VLDPTTGVLRTEPAGRYRQRRPVPEATSR
jgi:hypothetical protein